MRYIRKIAEPTVVAAYGEVGPGGLGIFNLSVYEEVEGDLPEVFTLERIKPVDQRIKDIVAQVSPSVLIRYAGEAGLIAQFLNEKNIVGAVSLIGAVQSKMQLADDTEGLAALAPITELLEEEDLI